MGSITLEPKSYPNCDHALPGVYGYRMAVGYDDDDNDTAFERFSLWRWDSGCNYPLDRILFVHEANRCIF